MRRRGQALHAQWRVVVRTQPRDRLRDPARRSVSRHHIPQPSVSVALQQAIEHLAFGQRRERANIFGRVEQPHQPPDGIDERDRRLAEEETAPRSSIGASWRLKVDEQRHQLLRVDFEHHAEIGLLRSCLEHHACHGQVNRRHDKARRIVDEPIVAESDRLTALGDQAEAGRIVRRHRLVRRGIADERQAGDGGRPGAVASGESGHQRRHRA